MLLFLLLFLLLLILMLFSQGKGLRDGGGPKGLHLKDCR